MQIRPFLEDEARRSTLEECGLTRPWNDPRRDIARKLEAMECLLSGVLGNGDALAFSRALVFEVDASAIALSSTHPSLGASTAHLLSFYPFITAPSALSIVEPCVAGVTRHPAWAHVRHAVLGAQSRQRGPK